MAIHSVIEINHDLAHKFKKDKEFGQRLYYALAGRYPTEFCKKVLGYYGIKVIDQHHSSVKGEWKEVSNNA